MKRCSSCVLPEYTPKIEFDEDGVCNVCKDFETQWSSFHKNKSSRDRVLNEIFNTLRDKDSRYDCLVPISGGLDSTYALYMCKRIYNLRTLAFNFNNGFQTGIAKQNIENAIDKLDVDYITTSTPWEKARKLYALFFRKTGEFCTPCNMGIWSNSFKIASDANIPLIVAGASNRISERLPRGGRIYGWSPSYFKEVIRDEIPLEDVIDYLYVPENIHNCAIKRSSDVDFNNPKILHLPDFIDWNSISMVNTLENELNWEKLGDRFHHIDCMMESVNDHLKQRRWGLSSAMYYSMLMRTVLITRDQALEQTMFEEERNSSEPPELETWLELLGLSREDLNDFDKRSNSIVR